MTRGRAIVLLDGRPPDRAALDAAWPGWDIDVALVVAADGGARLAALLGLRIDRWVGDGDSLGEEAVRMLEAAGVAVDRQPVDKDATDGELAIRAAIRLGATSLVLLGALGGARVDQFLGNVGLLALGAGISGEATIVDSDARIRLLSGPASARLEGRVGDLVSLLPWGGATTGVTTAGLRYPLAGETLPFGPGRGISNVRSATTASVDIEAGRLLIVEVPARLAQ